MLNKVRKLLKMLSANRFDGIVFLTAGEDISLELFVGCIVLMHYYLFNAENIAAVARAMISRYPLAVNKKVLNMENEVLAFQNGLVANELSQKIGSFISLGMASDRDLEETVASVMRIYFNS